MKKIRFLISVAVIICSNSVFSQSFEFTGATDNGSTVTETVSGVTVTISGGTPDIFNSSGFYTHMTGDAVWSSTQVSTLTVSFSTAVDITSVAVANGYLNSLTYVLTPTGGSNSTHSEAGSGSTGINPTLNWTGVTSFTVTQSGGGNQAWAIDNIIIPAGDTTAPVFENSTPSSSSITQTGFTLGTDIDEAGTIYYVLLEDGTTAPSSSQVIAGTDGNDSSATDSGSQAVSSGDFSHDFSISGLTAGSSYDIYVVAQDDEGSPNVQASPTLLEVTTTSTLTWDGSTDNNWATADNWTPATVPGSGTDVTIPSGLTNYPTASSAVSVNTISIASGASLIAQSTLAGTITYTRNLATDNWYLVGAPVSGETIEDMISNNSFATGTGSNIGLAPYDNSQATAADRWDYQTAASTGSLTSGGGYSVKLASAGNLTFSGNMEVLDVGVSITSGAGNAFNLVGNPYPSYLAGNDHADATNNLLKINTSSLTEETLWLWNESTSSYDQFNQTTSPGTGFFIAPGQGFFVSSTGSNTFNFTEDMQSHQSSDMFQRSTNNRPEISLMLTDGTTTRDTDIFYIDGTTTGFDNGYDSSMFGGVANEFAIYTHTVANGSGRNLGIQSLPNANFENMVIPIGINATSGTDITISATISNLPSGVNVYLEDTSDNSFTLLNETENFSTTLSSDLHGIGRFYIRTSSQSLSVNQANLENISIYMSDENNLRIVGVQSGTTQIQIYDLLGKQVVKTSFEGNRLNNVTLPDLRTGVYIIQLKTETGALNKKVIIE